MALNTPFATTSTIDFSVLNSFMVYGIAALYDKPRDNVAFATKVCKHLKWNSWDIPYQKQIELSPAAKVAEGQSVPVVYTGMAWAGTASKYVIGASINKTLQGEKANLSEVFNDITRQLGQSIVVRVNKDASNFLALGFGDIPDLTPVFFPNRQNGQPLFSDKHVLANGSTMANTFSVRRPISMQAMDNVYQQGLSARNMAGQKEPIRPKYYIMASELTTQATIIQSTDKVPNSANNDTNLQAQGQKYNTEIIYNYYDNGMNNWYMQPYSYANTVGSNNEFSLCDSDGLLIGIDNSASKLMETQVVSKIIGFVIGDYRCMFGYGTTVSNIPLLQQEIAA